MPQDEGQAQKHWLSRGCIAGYHRPQQQYSRCQLRLRLCAGGHAEAYGDGVTVGLKSQGRKARTFI